MTFRGKRTIVGTTAVVWLVGLVSAAAVPAGASAQAGAPAAAAAQEPAQPAMGARAARSPLRAERVQSQRPGRSSITFISVIPSLPTARQRAEPHGQRRQHGEPDGELVAAFHEADLRTAGATSTTRSAGCRRSNVRAPMSSMRPACVTWLRSAPWLPRSPDRPTWAWGCSSRT